MEFEAFSTLDKVKDLFTNKVSDEEWNTFCVLFKNYAAETGGYVGAMCNRYEGLLIGLGSKGGLAFYKLMKQKVLSKTDIKKMRIQDGDNFVYMPKEFVDKVEIKHPPLNKKVIIVQIRFTTNDRHDLMVKLGSVDLPYQESGVNELINRYKKER